MLALISKMTKYVRDINSTALRNAFTRGNLTDIQQIWNEASTLPINETDLMDISDNRTVSSTTALPNSNTLFNVTELSEKLVNFANEYDTLPENVWKSVLSSKGVQIWRSSNPPKPFGGKSVWPSFKSRVVIDAHHSTIAAFLFDSLSAQKANKCVFYLFFQ
jgi:hypothetical protein